MINEAVKILIVEDELVIAMDVSDELSDAGYKVLGPAGTLREAQSAIEGDIPTAAVLDMNLKGEMTFDLARSLCDQQVPVLFLSGDESSSLPEDLRHCQILTKPFGPNALKAAVADLLATQAGARQTAVGAA